MAKKVSRRHFARTSMAAGAAAIGLPAAIAGADEAAAGSSMSSAAASGMAAAKRVRTTLPPEYYLDPARYAKDEAFLRDNVWLLVDHESRIPKPGDYFVFEFGRGESVSILRNQAGEIQGFHNVCRHRASRLVRHHRDPPPPDADKLSVKQLGPSGNSQVFRCPYHAWTYDLSGKLISAPNGMPADFDMSQNG